MAKEEKKLTIKEQVVAFFKGIKSEWGKISWPQKPQIISETIIVAIVVIFFTIVIFLMDVIFKGILGIIPQ
ncbi:preprotein translocase subunit SecE [bacterium]|nr:preprotein translocase subunit SecE [bacterium]